MSQSLEPERLEGRVFLSGGAQDHSGRVTAGEFNGDGRADLVVLANPRRGGGTPTLLVNRGDGAFDFGPNLPVAEATGVHAADFNGDGRTDLLVSARTRGTRTIAVLPGNGDGTFGGDLFNGQIQRKRGAGGALATGDFNGDGRTDIAFDDGFALSGRPRQMRLILNTPNTPTGISALSVDAPLRGISAMAGIRRAGGDGLLVAGRGGRHTLVRVDNLAGVPAVSKVLETGGTDRAAAVFDADAADFTGDGLDDIVATGRFLQPTGAAPPYAPTAQRYRPENAAVPRATMENGFLSPRGIYAGEIGVWSAEVADFDGNGVADLLVAARGATGPRAARTPAMYLLRGTPMGTFQIEGTAVTVHPRPGTA